MGKQKQRRSGVSRSDVVVSSTPHIERRDSVLPPVGWYTPPALVAIPFSNSFPLTVVEAAGISAVRRCVTLIANAIAGQRWSHWSNGERIDKPVRLINRPSAMMTRREWVWRVVSSMALDDISYLYMTGGVDDQGIPGSLIPLPRQLIAPAGYVDPYGVFPPTSYTISGVPGTVSGEFVIPMRSAFWPGVPPHLIGILQMARNTMMSAMASESYAARYWQAGGSPTTVITTDQELQGTQADDLGARWRDRRAKGPDFPAVLGKGAHAEPWGADISNAVAIEARRDITIEVANLFGVNARYLNITPTGTSQTYSNVQDEALSLERFTLAGFVDPIQDTISDLLPDEDFMLIDMTRLTRASQEARFRAWAIATGNKAWMMPGEVRTEEGLAASSEIDSMEAAQVEGASQVANAAQGAVASKAAEKVPVE